MSRRSVRSRLTLAANDARIDVAIESVGIVSSSIVLLVTRRPSGSRPWNASPTISSASGVSSHGP